MTTPQQEQRQAEAKRTEQNQQERGLLEAVVRDNVLRDLGRPSALHRVQVTRVWDDHYRVNVFIGKDAVSFKVAHSYFMQTDGNGKILLSSPAITRVYESMRMPSSSLSDSGMDADGLD